MATWVLKFGGSSVASVERIQCVAAIIRQACAKGHQIAVVVSAMQGDTDLLVQLAHEVSSAQHAREWDALVASAEQKSAALLSMALCDLGVAAQSLIAHQVGMKTTDRHQKAQLLCVDVAFIQQLWRQDKIPVITGFQGVNNQGDITTLGRGGSDITAVALAGFLAADECQIYTDVQGVYTSDPQVVHKARLLETITFAEMLALSGLGAKVLHRRAVEFACRYHIPVRVLSSFEPGPGTLIYQPAEGAQDVTISGVAFESGVAQITISNLSHQANIQESLRQRFNQYALEVDLMISNQQQSHMDLHFTVSAGDVEQATALTQVCVDEIVGTAQLIVNTAVAKLSLVGLGIETQAAVSSKMLQVLADQGIVVSLIASTELKVTVVIDQEYIELAARLLHGAFELETPHHAVV